MKRALSFLIALALCLTFLPTSTFAATVLDSGTCGGNLTWTQYDDGTTVISGSGEMTDYQTATMTPWISSWISNLVISSGVTRIGNDAFEDTPPLKSVWIGDTVTQIGMEAFASCPQLTKVVLYASVTDIEYGAFYKCDNLTDVYYYGTPEQWAAINIGYANSPLYNATVHYVDVSAPVTLESIAVETLPDKTTYGKNESLDTTGLTLRANYSNGTSQEITSGFTVAGFDSETVGVKTLTVAYEGLTASFEVTVWQPATSGTCGSDLTWNLDEQGILTISGTGGMYSYSSVVQPWLSHLETITTVIIESGVTDIGGNAFEDCTNLKSVTISDTVTYIGKWAFAGCTGLEEINYNAAAISSLGQSNYVFSRAGAESNGITVNIGANVTKIPAYLFQPGSYSYEHKITAVNFAEGSVCTSIGDSAFYNCTGLTSITIPDSVTSIGDSAFSYCTGLTSITIGDSVTSIGNWAFSSCTGLTSVTIPEGVTSIGNYAFHNCTSLTDVYYCGTHEQWSAITIGSNNNPLTAATLHVTEVVVTLTGIAIKTQSAKTEYWVGESLDTTCLTLMATYSDGSTKEITEGFTVTGFDSATAGEKTVTVTYEDFTATFTVMVKEPTITGITVKAQPAKTEYWVGESLDTTGLTLTATYSDGSTQEITEGFTVSGFDSATAGEKTVTVTYEGFTATFTVAVNETVIDENAPKIVLESKKVVKGSEFTVTVKIENNPGFTYLEVTPTYDGVLTLVKVENGELISDFTKGKQYVWVADEDVTDDGLLMTFTFSVADTVEPGIYQAGFQLRTCGNYNEEAVTLNIVAADIEVIDYVYGDATGDGVVDGFDVIRLKKYLANYDYETGTSTVEIAAGADANGDGTIDGFDVIRLKKYLANYDYETGSSTVVLGPQ